MGFYMIGGLQIPQRNIKEKELYYFETNNKEGVGKIFRELKELTGYSYDNRHLYFSNIFGELFTISIYFSHNERTHSKKWVINVWNHTGNQSLGEIYQDVVDKETDKLSDENYRKLCELTENFTKGKIKCSDCGKLISKSEIAGHFYAGTYCTDCWERKWKERESKENYD